MDSQTNFPQSEQSYHPKHHIKVYVWIALVVVAFLGAINGYLYFLRLSYLQQGAETARQNEQRIQELRAQRQGGQVDMSTWKIYRNEEYGFEFRYPGDLELSGEWRATEEGQSMLFFIDLSTTDLSINDGRIDIKILKKELELNDNNSKPRSVGNKIGYESFQPMGEWGGSLIIQTPIKIASLDNTFEISFYYIPSTHTPISQTPIYKDTRLIDQILSTFRFIE